MKKIIVIIISLFITSIYSYAQLDLAYDGFPKFTFKGYTICGNNDSSYRKTTNDRTKEVMRYGGVFKVYEDEKNFQEIYNLLVNKKCQLEGQYDVEIITYNKEWGLYIEVYNPLKKRLAAYIEKRDYEDWLNRLNK